MKRILTLLFIAVSLGAYSQGFELGLRAGATGTSGSTKLPTYTSPSVTPYVNVVSPEINANSNGMGYNFLAGVYAKVKIPLGFFVQGEIVYTQFTINQKATDITFVGRTPATPIGTQHYESIDVKSNLYGVNIPILFGKTFAAQLLRIYIGPNFLFVTSAKQDKTYNNGTNTGLLPPSKTGTETDILTNDPTPPPLPNRAVNPLIIGLEAGVGVNIPGTGLGFDLRYSVPVITGVYKNKDITGYLGIVSLTASYRLFKLGL